MSRLRTALQPVWPVLCWFAVALVIAFISIGISAEIWPSAKI